MNVRLLYVYVGVGASIVGIVSLLDERKTAQVNVPEIAATVPDTGRGPWAHPDAPTLQLWSEVAGVPTFLTYAIAWRETRNNPSPWVRGARGEVGRFQVMPATAKSRCAGIDVGTSEGNLACFLKMIRADLARCAGDARCAARIHNGSGPRARAYADSVMADVKILVNRRIGQ